MSWLQYDWWSRREMNAEGGGSWQKHDPWKLLSCLPESSYKEDCFVMSTDPPGTTNPVQQPGFGAIYQTPSKGQPYTPGGRKKRLNRVFPLFNKARAGCHYGEECIYAHRCSVCKREDHGKCTCPYRNQEGEKEVVIIK